METTENTAGEQPVLADASPTMAQMIGGPLNGQTIPSSRITPDGRTNLVDGDGSLAYRLISHEPLRFEYEDPNLLRQQSVEQESVSELVKEAQFGRNMAAVITPHLRANEDLAEGLDRIISAAVAAVEELGVKTEFANGLTRILGPHLGERGATENPAECLNRIISERDELAKSYAVITGDIMGTTQEELDAARATIARLQPK